MHPDALQQIYRLSGNPNHVSPVVSAPGNGLKLRFVTDNGITLTGFHARFKRVNASARGHERSMFYILIDNILIDSLSLCL